MPVLLSTAYLPPVQYISKFLSGGQVYIETHENFQKQSYRNRCYIYGANGRQCLVIPVKKHHGKKTPIHAVEIDYRMPWQKIHVKSIQAAYQTSPFYEFYADDFNLIFNEPAISLFNWNLHFLNYLLKQLGIHSGIQMTDVYENTPRGVDDYRQSIHPKTRLCGTDVLFHPIPYQQVFRERFGFIPNLSIIDLLFNEGPNAKQVLTLSKS